MIRLNRRHVIAAMGAAAALPLGAGIARAQEPLKVGFVYVGPVGDFGWTYAHDQGRKLVEETFGDKVKVTFVENVAEGPDAERIVIEPLSDTFSRIRLTFGYMEQPNVPRALALARKDGMKFDIMSTSFFLNRRTLKPSPDQRMPLWQDQLFIAMTKSASDPTTFYRLPSNRVLELGQQMVV